MISKIKQEDVISRIEKVLDTLGISQTKLQGKASIFNVSRKMDTNNGKYVWTINDIKKICKAFPVSEEWLLYGNGEILIEQPQIEYDKKKGKPYYNVDFQMGFDMMVNDQTINPDYMIDCAPYNKCDCWCNARGDSMRPTISSGDAIAIKEIKDFSYLISGEIYAVVTDNDLRTIKRVKDNGDTLTLIPDNKDYPEQTIEKSNVIKIYRVLGCMKMF